MKDIDHQYMSRLPQSHHGQSNIITYEQRNEVLYSLMSATP